MNAATASPRAASGLESRSPATGEPLGAVPMTAPERVGEVVAAVAQAQPFWAALRPDHRARYLRRAAQVVIDETDEIRDLIVREQGKPRNEAYLMEVLPTIDTLRWLSDNGPAILAEEPIPTPQVYFRGKSSHFVYEPLGVVAVIAPWNYPWTIPLGEVATALMAGNGVVLKPSSLTPLLGERIVAVLERAGVPEGLVRVVHGPGTGAALAQDDGVAKVFFTGSVEAGRSVGEACAARLAGSVLELGGKDPMIVLRDAPLEHAVAGALWAGFANAGQTCSGVERVYVAREVAERFTAALVERARALRIGDPLRWDTEIGPMISAEQRDSVAELVRDAVDGGAELLCGGPVDPPSGLAGAWYAPAVLTGVTHEMRIMREEIFGPVVPVVVVDDEEEAVALANDSRFGLGASVWTRDRARGERVAARLRAGMTWINDHMYSHGACQCSWGGVKESGLGVTHSRFGLHANAQVKLRVWEPSRLRNPWWHPYDADLGRAMKQSAAVLYGRESQRLAALRAGARPLARVAARLLRER